MRFWGNLVGNRGPGVKGRPGRRAADRFRFALVGIDLERVLNSTLLPRKPEIAE